MDQASESADGGAELSTAGDEAPESPAPSAHHLGPVSGPDPGSGVPGFAAPPNHAPPPGAYAPPTFGAPPPGPGASPGPYAPPTFGAPPSPGAPPGFGAPPTFGAPPKARNRRRTVIIISSIAAVVVVLAGLVVLVAGVYRHLTSTANVRVIVPAPATAGGLHQDYIDERKPRFQQALGKLRQGFVTQLRGTFSNYAFALYTNAPPGQPGTSATVLVVYAGFNISSLQFNTASNLRDALAGVAAKQTQVKRLPITAGPGNTSFGCESGFYGATPVATCGWATDRTLGLMLQVGPNASVAHLSALEK